MVHGRDQHHHFSHLSDTSEIQEEDQLALLQQNPLAKSVLPVAVGPIKKMANGKSLFTIMSNMTKWHHMTDIVDIQ